ncbi:MAG TPA: tetratricopeptide repeat protein [Enhygromyxa sp.]|nr:tetratricopeptide repeat protein [Enhygromyxa sp.]
MQRASVLSLVLMALLTGGCATTRPPNATTTAAPEPRDRTSEAPEVESEPEGDPSRWIAEGEAALEREQPAKAATLFARYLAHRGSPDYSPELDRTYRGLARAHEQLGDFEAAIRAYDGLLAHMPDGPDAAQIVARRGACEAEINQWERSADSYARVLELGGDAMIPSERVEALARRGFALFQLGQFKEADAALAEADAIFEKATSEGQERFSDTYFVGLARFYRAAIIHLEFRAAPIRLPEAQMSKDFEHKLALLEQAQDAYNQVIRARHIYWVSAAGFQLGSICEEFYDAVMHAPVPDWLDEQQRRTYYEELEEQLRPVLDKAVWVFEKNLETARKFGYEGEFIERTEAQLAQLQAIMLGRGEPGDPVPRLAPLEAREELDPDSAIAFEELPAAERKLFVPMPTTL